MKTVKILALTASLIFLFSERVIAQTNSGARVVRGELIYVLCGESVHVRDESLQKINFTADPFERISPYQGWGNIEKMSMVNGETLKFVKVEFLRQQEQSGWVAEKFVKLKSDCPGSELPQVSTTDDPLNNIRGLEDPKCCLFPLSSSPRESYTTGARAFGANRYSKKYRTYRAHAAVDLYTGIFKIVRTIAPGRVLYSPRYFYMDTYEVAVLHPGGFVARYGEISREKRHLLRGIEKDARVRTGQSIGHVGQTKEGQRIVAPPMLHLELYIGNRRGELTDRGSALRNRRTGHKYQRRVDLIDPTKHVQRWESMTF